MVAWGTIGSVLGGLGTFAGGLSSLFGGGSGDNMNEDWIRESIKNRLYAARVYGQMFGYHPLAALGINPAQGGNWRRTGDVGRSLHRMGQGLERALNGRNEVDKALARYYDAKADQIEAGKDEAQVPEITGNPPDKYGGQYFLEQKAASRKPGMETVYGPMQQGKWDVDWYFHPLIGKDASEPMETEWMANLRWNLMQAKTWFDSVKVWSGLSSGLKKEFMRKIMRQRPKTPEWAAGTVFDMRNGLWRAVPMPEDTKYMGAPRIFMQNRIERSFRAKLKRNIPRRLTPTFRNDRMFKAH